MKPRKPGKAGVHYYGWQGHLQVVLVVLLSVTFLPNIVRDSSVAWPIKAALLTLAPLLSLWGMLQSALPPVRIDREGVAVRSRTRLRPQRYGWDRLSGFGQDPHAKTLLALKLVDGQLRTLPTVAEPARLQRELGERLPYLTDIVLRN